MEQKIDIVRRGFDNYIPALQICNYFKIEFKGVLKSTKDDLKVRFLEVLQEDESEIIMICIHFESVQKYIQMLQEEFDLDDKDLIKFLFAMNKYHIIFENEMKEYLEEAYS